MTNMRYDHQCACDKQTILCITFLTIALCDVLRNICQFTSINLKTIKVKLKVYDSTLDKNEAIVACKRRWGRGFKRNLQWCSNKCKCVCVYFLCVYMCDMWVSVCQWFQQKCRKIRGTESAGCFVSSPLKIKTNNRFAWTCNLQL